MTYTAIAASYAGVAIPQFLAEMQKEEAGENPNAAPANAAALADPAKPAAKPADKPVPAAAPVAAPAKPTFSLGELAFVVVLLVGFLYALPVIAGFESPIGLLIIGFALWEAWKINRRTRLDFQGPFVLSVVRKGRAICPSKGFRAMRDEAAGASPEALTCPSCGTEIAPRLLTCPGCQRLIHADRLKRLAEEAEHAQREGHAGEALALWREALELLPPRSRQHQVIAARVEELSRQADASPAATARAGEDATAETRKAWAGAARPVWGPWACSSGR